MKNSIVSVKNYGHIELKLRKLMEEKSINRNQLATGIRSRFEVIEKWHSGNVEKLDLDVLARVCYVLDCSVSDILEYSAN